MTTGKQPRIVVGIDGSPESKDALRWAADEARATGATVDAVISWDMPTGFGWGVVLPDDYDPAADARSVLEQAIVGVLGSEPDVAVRLLVERGQPAEILVRLSDGADELVVGSRGRGGFTGLLLGSTSSHCLHHARCPVVVVRHHG